MIAVDVEMLFKHPQVGAFASGFGVYFLQVDPAHWSCAQIAQQVCSLLRGRGIGSTMEAQPGTMIFADERKLAADKGDVIAGSAMR